mmetsp:Transcript_123376/g.348622  ORF Transcript_123376/g.348622 Transcript_123376/m.348622 type:complete len:356 (+) Transcript_123376:258-1325(+)
MSRASVEQSTTGQSTQQSNAFASSNAPRASSAAHKPSRSSPDARSRTSKISAASDVCLAADNNMALSTWEKSSRARQFLFSASVLKPKSPRSSSATHAKASVGDEEPAIAPSARSRSPRSSSPAISKTRQSVRTATGMTWRSALNWRSTTSSTRLGLKDNSIALRTTGRLQRSSAGTAFKTNAGLSPGQCSSRKAKTTRTSARSASARASKSRSANKLLPHSRNTVRLEALARISCVAPDCVSTSLKADSACGMAFASSMTPASPTPSQPQNSNLRLVRLLGRQRAISLGLSSVILVLKSTIASACNPAGNASAKSATPASVISVTPKSTLSSAKSNSLMARAIDLTPASLTLVW